MTTEQLNELFEKTSRLLNLKGYIEDYNESIGISEKDIEKSITLFDADLDRFLSELSPGNDVYDSVVFTTDGQSDAIEIVEGKYIGVPFYKDGRTVNVRVSIVDIH